MTRKGLSRQESGCTPSAAEKNRAVSSGRGKEGMKSTTSVSKWRWPWVHAGRREPIPSEPQAPKEPCSSPPGSSSSLEPGPAAPQQEAAPCQTGDEGPATLGQELSQAHSSPSPSHCSSWDDWHTSQQSGNTNPSISSSLEDSENSSKSQSTSTSSSSSSEDTNSSEESTSTTSTSSSSSEDSSSSLEFRTSPAPGASHTVIPSPASEELEEEDRRSLEETVLLLVKKHLQDPGKHFTSCIELPDAQHHALGMKIFTSIIACAVQLLPQFEGYSDIPEVGDMAACLGLSISDPVESIGCKAREGVYWLAQILLQQRGQDMQGAEELWCKCQMQQRQVQNYRDLVRAGEGLRKILLKEQRRSFLQRALHAVHNGHMHISQAGLVFLYATLGEASRLMGHKEKEIPIRALNKLFAITCFKDLQGHSLLASSSSAPSSFQPPTLGPAGAVLSPLPLRDRYQ
ncbi:PREDICTED: uncharacterized protein LOC109308738 [Crocodylus porosus]|uniref:uncharacterized protein LOC109308738 n=1 Tax=Crocodylus porosus TaxID=8502 RepID=UPI00093F07C4|nr:PREDICTED: uncharacterized protein LOC109308738 [Crocodylus porosus]